MNVSAKQDEPAAITPRAELRRKIEELSGEKISACFQCQKCTSGCPVTFAMEMPPHQLIRRLHLGQLAEVLAANTYWVCAACETCSTRCPNSIDIAHVMDTLRQYRGEGSVPAPKTDRIFHQEFLNSIRQHGRVHELGLVTKFTLKARGLPGLVKQGTMGLTMMLKGKLGLFPERIRGKKQVKAIFKNTEKEASQ